MKKRFLLGAILISTITVYSAERLHLQSPYLAITPTAKLNDQFDNSLRENNTKISPLSAEGNNLNIIEGILQSSPTPIIGSQTESPSQLTSEELIYNFEQELPPARPTTPTKGKEDLTKELLATYSEFWTACIKRHNEHLTKLFKPLFDEFPMRLKIKTLMQSPDSDEDCKKFAKELYNQQELAERCGIGEKPTSLPTKSGHHKLSAFIRFIPESKK